MRNQNDIGWKRAALTNNVFPDGKSIYVDRRYTIDQTEYAYKLF